MNSYGCLLKLVRFKPGRVLQVINYRMTTPERLTMLKGTRVVVEDVLGGGFSHSVILCLEDVESHSI